MILNVFLLFAGIVLLYGGAEGLVRGSVALARRLSISPLVIGLTVVAFGTSMPELVVSVRAALAGDAGIAAGNVVGSNIANIALILGASALFCPLAVNARIIRIDLPILVLISAGAGVMFLDQSISRGEGLLLLTGLVVYASLSIWGARRETVAIQGVFEGALPEARGSLPVNLALVAIGLVLLVLGARFLLAGAVALAEAAGLSEAVIGLTVVAVGTSLPELATSILAALRKEGDIAAGNIVGSNLFNLLGILGISSLVRPLLGVGMTSVDLGLMIFLAVLLLPLARSGWRLTRAEGLCLLLVYGVYTVYLLRGAALAAGGQP